jgi:hypothetical protein
MSAPPRPAQVRPQPLGAITNHADVFKVFAAQHPELLFFLARVGCGSAGFSDRQIAPLFLNAPANVLRPPEWGRDSARHRDSDRTKKKRIGRIREANPFFVKAFMKRVGM